MDENGTEFDVVTFRHAEMLVLALADKYGLSASESFVSGEKLAEDIKFAIVYTLSWNEFRGERKLQYQVEDFRLL